MKSFWRLVYVSVWIGLLTTSTWAAAQTEDADQADPPGRVARVDYMTGEVSVQPHGTDEWVQADQNRPLTLSDNVWADKDSRAELDLGTGRLRINSETSITLTNITNDAVQIALHQGTLNVHVRHLYAGEVWEVDTPNLAFSLSRTGDYRFDVDPNADATSVTVWKGEGEATGQGTEVRLKEGEQAQFTNGNSLTHQTHDAPAPDGFDDWCRVRDQGEDRSASMGHVAPGVVGGDDLDQYGTWRQSPDYGWVWSPTGVAPGWAPYSYGQWVWQAPWGWTWVDAYPWGFAPFHYGRWVWWGGAWGWAPGPYWVRPWYAPAMVAWFGGPHFGFSFGFGFGVGFGWCPLGWGEPFYPWYHVSPYYFHNVNIANTRITNINHISNDFFRNGGRTPMWTGGRMPQFANKPGAMTAMSRTGLEHGLPVRGNSVKVSANQLQGASALGRIDANPTRTATLGGRLARPPAATLSERPTVSRMTPPATRQTGLTSGRENAATRPSAGQSARASEVPGAAGNRAGSAPGQRYVPRPPQSSQSRTEPSMVAMNHSVPRPPSETRPGSTSLDRMGTPTRSQVPRPSGQVAPRPSHYSGNQGSYYARSYRDYAGTYSNRAYSNYGGYGRAGNSSSRYGAPPSSTYGGHRSYSAPSHSSGASSGYSGGSHGGGGGGHASGGSHGGHR